MISQNVDKPIQIMTDKGAWQFTDEQIRQIKNKDQNAMYKFYQDNYEIFCKMAGSFISLEYSLNGYRMYEFNDLMQQVYVDLPYYSYSSRTSLYRSIVFGTFKNVNFGGITSKGKSDRFCISIYATNKNNKEYCVVDKYVSYIPNYDEKEDLAERKQKNKAIELFLLNSLKDKKQLNAMYCKVFTDLPIRSLKGDEYEQLLLCKEFVVR